MIQKPNFFIIGAPKCGTTAMAKYLGEHPNVLMSAPKEPHYFCTDIFFTKEWDVSTDDEYMAEFYAGRTHGNIKAMGEASVFYMFSQVAVKRILKFNPNAKFIVMVRNPVDAAHSLFSQYSFAGWEVSDFMQAWRLQAKRSIGESIPKNHPNDPRLLQYGGIYKFGEQLGRLYSQVPKENVLVLNFDEFKDDNRNAYVDCLQFIGVEDDGRTDFSKVNYSRLIKSKFIVRLLKTRLSLNIAKALKTITGVKSLGIGRPQPQLSSKNRQEVLDYYKDDIKILSNILGKDLRSWTNN